MTDTTTTTPVVTDEQAAMHDAIVKGFRDMRNAKRDLIRAIKAAKAADLHVAYGHETWTAYVTAIVADMPKDVSKAEREWFAVTLVHFGVSQRDAAKATDTSAATVNRRVKATGEDVAAEVAEATGDADDAKPATTTTDAKGREQSRDAKRGKGKAKATPKAETPKATAPVEQPKRTANAVATEAAAAIVGVWHNLTVEQRSQIADMILDLPLNAS